MRVRATFYVETFVEGKDLDEIKNKLQYAGLIGDDADFVDWVEFTDTDTDEQVFLPR